MLQSLRDGAQSTTVKVIIGLIIISFAGFGLESLLPGGSGNAIAEVNGDEISPQQLQQAIDNQKRQLAQVFGDNLDPAMLDNDRLRPAALEGLIERQLLLQEAGGLGLQASQREIGRVVAGIEAFQVDGQFSPEQYRVVLANAGLSPERFRRAQAQDVVLGQIQAGLLSTEFTTGLELAAAANVIAEERDVRYLLVDPATLLPEDTVTDAEIAEYYADNTDRFVTDEAVIVHYLELAREDFVAPVDEEELRAQFEDVRADYQVAEQAQVSHILLVQGDDESDRAYAERVAAVAARLEAGEDFSGLAQALSDDIGSASLGGELGLTDGSAFPEPMEEAIAQLAVGAVSGAVETEAGTHFIRVDDRIAGESADDDALRAELATAIQTSAAEQALLSAVDTLRELSFNAPDLQGPAAAVGLAVQTSDPVTRSDGAPPFDNQRLREAAFAEEVLVAGNNSEVLELAGNRFVVLRVAERLAPETLPLEQVAEVIRAELEAKAIADARAALLASVRSRLGAGESIEAIAKSDGYEWRVELAARRNNIMLPREVLNAAFAMDTTEAVNLEAVTLADGQLALVQLARVQPGNENKLNAFEADQLREQLVGGSQQVLYLEYRKGLRDSADVVIR